MEPCFRLTPFKNIEGCGNISLPHKHHCHTPLGCVDCLGILSISILIEVLNTISEGREVFKLSRLQPDLYIEWSAARSLGPKSTQSLRKYMSCHCLSPSKKKNSVCFVDPLISGYLLSYWLWKTIQIWSSNFTGFILVWVCDSKYCSLRISLTARHFVF